MRRLPLLFTCVLASGIGSAGQQQTPPVFRGGVTLVRVDVTVLDKDGKPVPGLTADDFEVKLDGHARPVRALSYEQVALPGTPEAQPAAAVRAPREVSNAQPAAEPRLFVVMIDDLSIPPSRGKGMFFAAAKFVDALPSTDVIGFTTSSGSATINPTKNRAAVDAALRHAAGELNDPRDLPPDVPVGTADALEILAGNQSILKHLIIDICFPNQKTPSDTQIAQNPCADAVQRKVQALGEIARATASQQIQAYINVINAMKPAPGLKELVVLSDGLGVSSRYQLASFQPVAHAAAAAGVQLSVLSQDPDLSDVAQGGASSVSNGPRALQGSARYADNRTLVFDLMGMTDMAGGTFYRVLGQPGRFFNAVALATSAVYHLGVEAPAGAAPNGDFTVSARVTRSGLTVHANHVALLPAPTAAVPVDEQLRSAVTKGLANYAVPLTMATALRRSATSAGLDLDVNVEVAASAVGPLTAMYGLLDETGNVHIGRATITSPPTGDSYRISVSLPVTSGSHRLRFAIADASGHVGSLDAPVKAELAHLGSFQVSDILTSWSGADGKPQFLALEEVPAAATELTAFLELYQSSDVPLPADVQVRWSVIASDTPPAAEQLGAPARAADRLTATAKFPLGSLPVGEYELRATVLAGGTAVGSVSTWFRKAAREGLAPRALGLLASPRR